MATLRIPSRDFLTAFLPIARAQLFPHTITQPITKRITLLQRLRASPSLLPAALTPIPSLLSDFVSDLWDGILNAVPKKKTSHMKKRHRQLASGKGLKDVTALNKCSSCGRTKRAHVLCPYCVASIRRWFGNGFKPQKQYEQEEAEALDARIEERRAQGKKPLEKPRKVKEEGEENEGGS